MSETRYFTGPFAPMCDAYVTQKRVSGLDYSQQAMLLRMFDNFCKSYEIQNYTITKEIAVAWCQKRPNEKDITRYGRVGEMQRFAQYLCRQGYPSYLLPTLPKRGETHTPYIFSIEKFFRGILWDVGIPYRGTQYGPRVHDLRHTFCCHNIQRWAEAGLPIYSNLLVLSRYLGHTSISATQWYLRLTAQAFPYIRDICEKELGGMYAPFDFAIESEGVQDG